MKKIVFNKKFFTVNRLNTFIRVDLKLWYLNLTKIDLEKDFFNDEKIILNIDFLKCRYNTDLRKKIINEIIYNLSEATEKPFTSFDIKIKTVKSFKEIKEMRGIKK